MTNGHSDHGQKKPDTDREHAELRGTHSQADYEPGSEEGHTFTGEIGKRGDTTSLRGHETGGLTPKNPKQIDRREEHLG